MRKLFTFLFAALMSVGMYATTVVTITEADFPTDGSQYSFTKDVAYKAEFKAAAPAGKPIVVFEANGKKKEVQVEVFPRIFLCNWNDENGELDYIIKELYALPFGGYCEDHVAVVQGDPAVTAAIDYDNNQSITISKAFEGTTRVIGNYIKYKDDSLEPEEETFQYVLTISVKYGAPTAVENVQTNSVQATKILRDGMLLIEKNGKIYNALGNEVK